MSCELMILEIISISSPFQGHNNWLFVQKRLHNIQASNLNQCNQTQHEQVSLFSWTKLKSSGLNEPTELYCVDAVLAQAIVAKPLLWHFLSVWKREETGVCFGPAHIPLVWHHRRVHDVITVELWTLIMIAVRNLGYTLF